MGGRSADEGFVVAGFGAKNRGENKDENLSARVGFLAISKPSGNSESVKKPEKRNVMSGKDESVEVRNRKGSGSKALKFAFEFAFEEV